MIGGWLAGKFILLLPSLALQDAEGPRPTDRKSVLLRQTYEKLRRSSAPFLGEGGIAAIERRIQALEPDAPPATVLQLHASRGDERLQSGLIDEAIEDYEKALAIAKDGTNKKTIQNTYRRLGLAWLRKGERQNCFARHNADSCLFPLRDGALHVEREGSENAVRWFTEAMKVAPNDWPTIWLLNLAHMTLGTWPDGVPSRWRIPASALESEHSLPRMYDVARKHGLANPDRAGGAILDDFTGDGLIDLVTSSLDMRERLHFWEQQPDRTFVEVGEKKGLAGVLGGLQVLHFDANNDGRLDLLVQRGGWMGSSGEIPNSLLVQQEDGTFLDRTLEAGIEVAAPSQTAAFADVDNDGDVDLFVGYEDDPLMSQGRYSSRMYLNRGDATFEDVSQKARVARAGFVKGAAFGDYDRDGLPDLYVSTMRGPNHLYRNEGDGKFRDVAEELGVTGPSDSFSCFFFDYDNDGFLDIYASGYAQVDRPGAVGAWYQSGWIKCETNRLYRNNQLGGFEDVTKQVGLERVTFPMGSNFGDVDNDGWLDFYLATGAPEFSTLMPNVLYRNDRGRRFQDVTTATGTGHLQKGHGVAFADWDDDGDQDLFVQLGGAYPDDGFADALYENPGHGHHWLTVRLVGTKSNRFGLGARIRVRISTGGDGTERDVFSFIGTNSSFGGNSLQAEIGLGDATRIVEVEIFWPKSATTQKFTDVPVDRTIRVVEGESALQLVDRRADD